MRKFIAISVILFASLFSYEVYARGDNKSSNSEDENNKSKLEFKIETKECLLKIKCSYSVRLKRKITKSEIASIANSIKNNSPPVQHIFIEYMLPCMKTGEGAWATSHFDPDLNVVIMDYMTSPIVNPQCAKYK